jgi:hypothetical protein
VGKGASVRARGRVWPRRRLDARRYPLTFSVPPRTTRPRLVSTARNAALGAAVDFRVVSETHSCGLFSLSFSGNRRGRAAALPRCGGGIRAATVRPRTRLSRRGLRAFTERDGQESQRKTPPGCVSPALVAEPRPAPRAIRRFLGTAAAGADSRETMRRRRARRRANSLNDAFVIKRGRVPATSRLGVDRARVGGDCLSRPRRERVTMSAPRRPSRRRRSPPPLFPSSQIRRQVLLPGEGAGLPLARVVQARAAEPQV